MEKRKVAVLGVTGAVGHRFSQLLGTSPISKGKHPWFDLEAITGSERSAGKTLAEQWHFPEYYARIGLEKTPAEAAMPEEFGDMRITKLEAGDERVLDELVEKGITVAFSALPKYDKQNRPIAEPVEQGLAKRGVHVFSNAGTQRMDRNVPLVIPEINGVNYLPGARRTSDYELIAKQPWYKEKGGFIVKNPNCAVIGLALALMPFKHYGFNHIDVLTNQALSGAGFSAYLNGEMNDNVIPYITGEEEKIQKEIFKIMHLADDVRVTASCTRVPVPDGHMEYPFVNLKVKPDLETLQARMRGFNPLKEYDLPTSPPAPLVVEDDLLDSSTDYRALGVVNGYDPAKEWTHPERRPQPQLDVYNGMGMAVSIGQIEVRQGRDHHIKFTILSHNTIRGAAGASVLNAELVYRMQERGEILQGRS